MNNEIYIVHKDWEGICCISDNTIYRKNFNEEHGTYNIIKNKISIKWKKWNNEDFFCGDNINVYYLKNIFYLKYTEFYIHENDDINTIILNKENNDFIVFDILNIVGTFKIDNNILILNIDNIIKKYKKINDINYYYMNDNNLFDLKIIDNLIEENYLFNKLLKKFYNMNDFNNKGTYQIIDNTLHMKTNNGIEKKFYTNKYMSIENVCVNLNIIRPNNIIINNQVLFSNISLCKNKIILSSIHYKNNSWDINSINISIMNHNIIKKIIYDNDDYESSLTIILELETIVNNLFINVSYKKIYNYEIYLEQLNILDHTISAMTLFKDDYLLLKRYFKYYYDLGIEIFFIYYNKKIDEEIINNIAKLNIKNVKIYLIEWDYKYWWTYGNDLSHHHSQTMAINDSFNILKNYGKYTLYNDLDEYIILDTYKNFYDIIKDNENIDIFIFKNRFCKMGHDLIKYEDFDEKFDLSQIIEGNYWDSKREKNLVKLKNINVMGVHGFFKKFNDDKILEKSISEFYHIINFKEKHREILMTQYIT
jgi:hypothetical protein